jgi:radical SAM protein with 4Fe4S-binding SPASM domain
MSSISLKKKCWLPWCMFRIMSDGDITMCCSNRSIIGNIERNSFDEIWNSENAVRFRSLVAEGRYTEAGCATCAFWYAFSRHLFEFPESELPLTEVQVRNREIQIEEYHRGTVRLRSQPSMLFIQPSYLCNLNCIMCNQKQVRREPKESPSVMPGLMLHLVAFEPVIENIILQGGEPLLVPEILGYLEREASGKQNHTITLNTNGLLFHLHEGILRKIRWLKINFSVDAGSQEIYEKIRAGGNWDRLVRNIDLALRITRERGGEWSINIQNLIMKSNVEHVHEMVQFWAERASSQRIYPVLGVDNTTENVFVYNHLLDQVPRWHHSLDEASRLATEYGLQELRLGLQYCKELIECEPLLGAQIHRLLIESMEEGEFLDYYSNIAAYKTARVNGFTNMAYHNYLKLRHFGFSN